MRLTGPVLTLLNGLALAGLLMARNRWTSTNTARYPNKTTNGKTMPAARPGTAASSTYAGGVYEGTASVAITVAGGEAIAYLCDGHRTGLWLRGTAIGGQLTLIGSGCRLTGAVADGVAAGTITAAQRRWPFGVLEVTAPSGLYRTDAMVHDTAVVAAWIVLADGRQIGVLDNGGHTGPAPTLDTTSGTATVDGTAVPAALVGCGIP